MGVVYSRGGVLRVYRGGALRLHWGWRALGVVSTATPRLCTQAEPSAAEVAQLQRLGEWSLSGSRPWRQVLSSLFFVFALAQARQKILPLSYAVA